MPGVTRRVLLRSGVASAALIAAPGRLALGRDRPQLHPALQSGDVTAGTAVVWARGDRASRMRVELASTPSFRDARPLAPRTLTRATDFTGKLRLGGLPAGREVFYRVTLEDASFAGPRSTPLVGSFRTAPDDRRDVSFVWSGDLGGQGFGINPAVGGYRIFAAMGALEPDFFLCSGDLGTPTTHSPARSGSLTAGCGTTR